MNAHAQAALAGVVMLATLAATAAQTPTAPAKAEGVSLFVAVDGKDDNPGTEEKPFATLDRARDEIRRLKKVKAPVRPITVNLRAGTYFLERTFRLTAEDSGTVDAPIVYRGYGKERPKLIGGKAIKGFTQHKDQILVADVASQGLKGVAFKQLFFDGRRQIMARYPNFDPKDPIAGGWAYVDGKIVSMYSNLPGESKRLLHFKAEDARTWARCQDGDVSIFPRYNGRNNIVRIDSVDRENRTITLAANCSYAIRPGDRYYVQGLFEELDAPGEWRLDQEAGKLYFWPPAPLAGKSVVAPTLESIIEIGTGTAHVTIRGLDMECCEGTAVILNNTTDCLIAGCTVRKAGYFLGAGVRIDGGRANGVVGCDISETGASGVVIRGGDQRTLAPADNYADNNYIHHTGLVNKTGMGINLGGVGNRATHNLIHDGPRHGLEFSGNNHLIEYNHLRHFNLETTDTGVLYSGFCDWLSARGTVVRYNYLHDSPGFGRDGRTSPRWISPHPEARGIYLDDNCAGVDVIGNIVARCSQSAVFLHNARDTRVENNIFIDHGVSQVICNGWTDRSPYWRGSIAAMVKAYESVANEPAWQKMRGMATHPKDAILPGGLTMSGNVLSTNIFYYHDPNAKLYSVRDMPFDHNETDRNLVWHNGLPIATGQFEVSKAISDNLVANPGFEEGADTAMPTGWKWQARPSEESLAVGTAEAAAEGKRSLRIDAVKVRNATCNPPWPVVASSEEVAAQAGHTYKLSAKVKAAVAGTKVELMIQSDVAGAYFWKRGNPTPLGTEWQQYEVVFKVPAKGDRGYHEKRKAMRVRFDLTGKDGAEWSSEGTVWIDDVSLVEVESLDEWRSLQARGFDRHSLVADPLFVAPEKDDWRLKPESPAFKLGFQAIPIEKIGPYEDPLRASWPIVEALGMRERMSRPPSRPK